MTFFRKRQQKELEQVLTERDILGTQLVRRNDELALLHEKTKLQQSTLEKGEQHYKQRQVYEIVCLLDYYNCNLRMIFESYG